jgi:hypothetical protein
LLSLLEGRADVQAFKNGVIGVSGKTTPEGEDLHRRWKACWETTDTDAVNEIAQQDVDGMEAQKISDGLIATVVINNKHYRGALDAVRAHPPYVIFFFTRFFTLLATQCCAHVAQISIFIYLGSIHEKYAA